MLQNINKKKAITVFVVTLLILFGGWYGYQSFLKDRAINEWANSQADDLTINKVEHTPEHIIVDVAWHNGALFAEQYLDLLEKVKSLHPQKEVYIQINPAQSQANLWWLQHSAIFFEALSKQAYTEIEKALQHLAEQGHIEDYSFGMNKELTFFYIEPKNQAALYIVLPLA